MTRHCRQSVPEAAKPQRFAPLRRFRDDRRGVTAIEFALISVPFFGLLMAIFQSGLYFFTSEALDAAVQDAARNIYTGQAQSANVTKSADFVSKYLCPQTGGTRLSTLIDCSQLVVDVRPAPNNGNYSGIDNGADFYQTGSATKFCLGAPSDIVVVRVIYPLPIFAPVVITTTGKDVRLSTAGSVSYNNAGRKQLLFATAVFQNEPYANGYKAPDGC